MAFAIAASRVGRGDRRAVPPRARGEHAARRARRRRPLVTASDRLRPDGIGFGVALAHVYPSTLFGDALAEVERVAVAAVHAIGLRNGIAYPQLLVSPHDNEVRIVEIAARIPGGQMVEVPRYGVGIDLVEIAVLQALGEPVPDELVTPRFHQPRRDPLPHRVARAAPDRRRARRSARSTRRSPSPASSAPRRGSSRARRSGPCRRTATAAAT